MPHPRLFPVIIDYDFISKITEEVNEFSPTLTDQMIIARMISAFEDDIPLHKDETRKLFLGVIKRYHEQSDFPFQKLAGAEMDEKEEVFNLLKSLLMKSLCTTMTSEHVDVKGILEEILSKYFNKLEGF